MESQRPPPLGYEMFSILPDYLHMLPEVDPFLAVRDRTGHGDAKPVEPGDDPRGGWNQQHPPSPFLLPSYLRMLQPLPLSHFLYPQYPYVCMYLGMSHVRNPKYLKRRILGTALHCMHAGGQVSPGWCMIGPEICHPRSGCGRG